MDVGSWDLSLDYSYSSLMVLVEDPIEHTRRRSREASFEEKPAFDFNQWELSNADSIV